VNPNESQLPNQLEGRSVKGQVRSVGFSEIARRCVNMFEVGMTPGEFCERYREPLEALSVTEGDPRERVQQARTALSLNERDVVLGQHKVGKLLVVLPIPSNSLWCKGLSLSSGFS
jgi:chitin synthase